MTFNLFIMKRNLLRCILPFSLFLTCHLQLFGQNSRTISGIINDVRSGERLPFATITINGSSRGTTSNVDGYFTLLVVPTTKLTLTVQYVGFNPQEIVLEGGVDILDLKVQLSEAEITLSEVIITANKYKFIQASEGVSSYKVSPKQMSILPSFGEIDIFRSLQLLPGISGTNESSSGLYVRGGTPDQNLVLLDGMTVYNVDHFFGFFSAFNADAIKDVQVFKGAFPAKYGGRLSSVVDLTGKTGDQNQFHGGLNVNMLNVKSYLQIPLFDKGSIVLAGRRSYTDIIQSSLYNNIFDVFNQVSDDNGFPQNGGGRGGGNLENLEVNTVEPDFYFYDLNGKITFHPTKKDIFSLSLYNGQDYLNESTENLRNLDSTRRQPARRIESNTDELSEWGNKGVSLKWSRQWNPKFYSNILAAYSNYFSHYNRNVINDVYNAEVDTLLINRNISSFEDNNVRDYTIRLDNEWQFNPNHKIDFGVWATQTNTVYNFVRNDTLTILDRDQKNKSLAVYVQDTWAPLPNLSINGGLRVTFYEATEQLYFGPRLSLKYHLNKAISLKGAYGKHYQFVNRIINENVTEGSRDFWLLSDNDLIGVSNADHYVIGASYENQGFLFDVEAYRKNLNNLSEFSLRFQRNDIDINRLFFTGTGLAQGIEFLIQKKTGKYTGWLSYTLSEVLHTFPDLNDGNEFLALHNQQHEFKAVNSLELGKRWTLGLTWVYGSGKPYTEPESYYSVELLDGREFSYTSVGEKNGSQLPDYHRMDISAHYKFKIGKLDFDTGLSIFNLYGRNNIWYREFDFTEPPPTVTDIQYLGFTPNLSISISF